MKLYELIEGRVSDLAYNMAYDAQHTPYTPPPSTPKKKPFNYCLSINGKQWGEFENEAAALRSATSMHNRKPYLKIQVMPVKK